MEVGASGLLEEDGMMMMMEDEIEWEHLLLDDIPVVDAPSCLEEEEAMGGSFDSSWMGEIEELLMKDDDDDNQQEAFSADDFLLSDILLDSPNPEPEVLDASSSSPEADNKNLQPEGGNANVADPTPNFDSNNDKTDDALELNDDSKEDDTDDGPMISKKRNRQLRNRDAAMRSRERKKMYVKELEMKSRHMEAECRRLGRLLQCCYAENHMLRLSLQSCSAAAFGGAAMPKPESAVLLLESLLLGSLVWFMATILCLLLLPLPSLSPPLGMANVDVKGHHLQGATTPRREKTTEVVSELWWLPHSFLRTKRCRASRTKMKSSSDLCSPHHPLFFFPVSFRWKSGELKRP